MILDTEKFYTEKSHENTRNVNIMETAGYYAVSSIRFSLDRKPSLWHRFWVRVVLGLTWVDA